MSEAYDSQRDKKERTIHMSPYQQKSHLLNVFCSSGLYHSQKLQLINVNANEVEDDGLMKWFSLN